MAGSDRNNNTGQQVTNYVTGGLGLATGIGMLAATGNPAGLGAAGQGVGLITQQALQDTGQTSGPPAAAAPGKGEAAMWSSVALVKRAYDRLPQDPQGAKALLETVLAQAEAVRPKLTQGAEWLPGWKTEE